MLLKLILLGSLFNLGFSMEYYSFIIDDKKCGYLEKELKDGILYTNGFVQMGEEKFENPFWVKIQDGKIIEYKVSDNKEWIKISKFKDNSFPTSAFELLTENIKDGESFEYNQIIEDTEEIKTGTIISRNDNKYIESYKGKIGRYLIKNDSGVIIEYGWGGTAKSILVKDKETALKNSGF